MAFDGLVEVGGALGPSFEAKAINVSEEGMHLRTAYLPEPGQPLTCRFDGGPGQSVLASGEVIWTQGEERGGEFGIRFTDMDGESVDALKRICGVSAGGAAPAVQSGSKVRLHIDGLASPMRAKIKDAHPTAVTVGSELGFLQVGRQLELEDAQSGSKRPACIDRVDVSIDPTSHVPQLVVTLRYSDVQAPAEAHGTPEPVVAADDLAAVEQASAAMKGAVARNLARVGPAFLGLASRARAMIAILARQRAERAAERSATPRTTALPPGGGLHANGRRVVRGEPDADEAPVQPKLAITKRRAAVAAVVMVAAVLGALAIKKSHHESPQEGAAPVTAAAAPASDQAIAPTTAVPAPPPPIDTGAAAPTPPSPVAFADEGADSSGKTSHKKHARVAPFGNGPVHHGNLLHLKMDGPIETLEGAQQPTGFAVKIPGRKSTEAASQLAARDSRIAAIKVSNEPAGAELMVAFKDGVPNYQVSAKGDTLVIALAPPGAMDPTLAKKDEKGGKATKHAKHDHEKKKGETY